MPIWYPLSTAHLQSWQSESLKLNKLIVAVGGVLKYIPYGRRSTVLPRPHTHPMRCSVMWSLQRSNVRDSASSCSSSLQSQMQLLQTKSRALAHRRAKLVRINYIIYILDRERYFSHANPNTMAHNFHSPVGYPEYLGIWVSEYLTAYSLRQSDTTASHEVALSTEASECTQFG